MGTNSSRKVPITVMEMNKLPAAYMYSSRIVSRGEKLQFSSRFTDPSVCSPFQSLFLNSKKSHLSKCPFLFHNISIRGRANPFASRLNLTIGSCHHRSLMVRDGSSNHSRPSNSVFYYALCYIYSFIGLY